MPPAKLGLIYGHTGLRKFLDTIGLARTKELFLTGRNFEAARRRADRPRPRGLRATSGSRRAAIELAAAIAANAPLSMRGNKQAIEMLNANPVLSEQQEAGLIALRESCFASEDLREGIRRLRREAQAALDGDGEPRRRRANAPRWLPPTRRWRR